MIHLHSTSPFGTANVNRSNVNSTNSADDAFHSALSSALSETLQKFGVDPSKVTLSIAPSATSPGSLIAPKSTPFGVEVASPAPATSAPSPTSTPKVSSTATQTPEDPIQAFDDAYWAKQPAEVQALRNMDDPADRTAAATKLATQGYCIDVPIMVWGWDPAKVTSLRQSFGYTWVPSAMQDPVGIAPGLGGIPGLSYDPNHAPAGSIAV